MTSGSRKEWTKEILVFFREKKKKKRERSELPKLRRWSRRRRDPFRRTWFATCPAGRGCAPDSQSPVLPRRTPSTVAQHQRSSSYTEFYRFTEFYRGLLGFTGFPQISLMCREFSCRMVLPSFTEFYRGLLGFTGFHNRSLGEAYWVLLGFPRLLLIVMGFHVFLMGSIGFQRILLGLSGFFP